MKTITLKVVVPKWARWVATESNGEVFAYPKKPKIVLGSFWWADSQRLERIAITTPPKDFTKTLRRIK